MKKPQSVPVEQARKEFADLLDGTQHKGEFVQITRRNKPAGVIVPPDWFDTAVTALAENKELRRENADLKAAKEAL
ncbi:type II toxin-antitoxin system Phd/YefM family antitoxin [Streptomyces sp. PD-S100-1]|uniref:type II toxin-antitoxin system Phd/YefM family antitoxin n=1 Tax=Streptomyces sp. PD-S100-1 TaxID=3394351 RepID=UPI0039BC5FA1